MRGNGRRLGYIYAESTHSPTSDLGNVAPRHTTHHTTPHRKYTSPSMSTCARTLQNLRIRIMSFVVCAHTCAGSTEWTDSALPTRRRRQAQLHQLDRRRSHCVRRRQLDSTRRCRGCRARQRNRRFTYRGSVKRLLHCSALRLRRSKTPSTVEWRRRRRLRTVVDDSRRSRGGRALTGWLAEMSKVRKRDVRTAPSYDVMGCQRKWITWYDFPAARISLARRSRLNQQL